MLGSHWRSYAAIGGLIGAVLLASYFAPWITLLARGEVAGVGQNQNRSTQQSGASEASARPKNQPPPADYQPECSKREDADLCAQVRMAEAAELQGFVNWFGLGLLGGTFIFTGCAAVFAGLTWRTMKSSAERELRAYISLGDPKLVDAAPDKKPTFEFMVLNSGRTFAQDVRVAVGFVLAKQFTNAPAPKILAGANNLFVGSGQHVPSRVGLDGLLSSKQYLEIREDRCAIFIYGTVTYADAFKPNRTIEFRLVYNSKNIARNSPALHVCDAGNRAD